MGRKHRSKAGLAAYAVLKTLFETIFGQIKSTKGLDRFRLQDLGQVLEEWALMATIHKLFRPSMATT